MYMVFGIYLILSLFKLQSLPNLRNRKIFKSIWFILLIIFTLNIFFHNVNWFEVPNYSRQLEERVSESKMFGKSELKEDSYLQYVYINYSSYSFIYLIENYGKILGISIIAILSLLLIKLAFNYQQTKDNYGKMLSIGIVCFLFIPIIMSFLTITNTVNFQSLNIPFIVHSDMNIIIYMISISLIMSIYSRKNINIISSEDIQNNS